jgi:hypothetical protein
LASAVSVASIGCGAKSSVSRENLSRAARAANVVVHRSDIAEPYDGWLRAAVYHTVTSSPAKRGQLRAGAIVARNPVRRGSPLTRPHVRASDFARLVVLGRRTTEASVALHFSAPNAVQPRRIDFSYPERDVLVETFGSRHHR